MGAGRDCRYSGARRGMGASGDIRGLLGGVGVLLGVWRHQGVGVSGMYWGWQGLQVFRGQKGYKALEALGLLRGVGAVLRVFGASGVYGCIGGWEGL